MAKNLFQNPVRYPAESPSKEARKNFCRRSEVWKRTLPLQVVLWLLIPGLSALGALYEVKNSIRAVEFQAVFWKGLVFYAMVMSIVLVLFYALQWRRAIAPLAAMKRNLFLSSVSIDMEYLPFNSQNMNERHELYPREQQTRERTSILMSEVKDICYYPQCDCAVVYGPVHFTALKGNKIVKKSTLDGKYGYRIYCGHQNMRQFAEEASLYSGVPVREMAAKERIPLEKQCKIWLV